MFIVRPKGILSTPRLLAQDLGVRSRFYPNPRRPNRIYDYNRDFFMMPIAEQHVRNVTPDYLETLAFMQRNKYGQRKALEAAGVPVPETHSQPADAWGLAFNQSLRFVVRPLRHSGGRGFRVTDNPTDFIGGQEYISVLYPKRREYRIVFVFGQPLIYLRKVPNEGVENDQPWGHINSTFRTINDFNNCRLAGTDCISRLSAFPAIRGAHIIAADILYNQKEEKPYVVLELNSCPALTIDDNRDKIVAEIRKRKGWLWQRTTDAQSVTIQRRMEVGSREWGRERTARLENMRQTSYATPVQGR